MFIFQRMYMYIIYIKHFLSKLKQTLGKYGDDDGELEHIITNLICANIIIGRDDTYI